MNISAITEKLAVIILCAMVSGCAQTTFWIKSDGTQEEFNRAQSACHSQAYFLPKTQTPTTPPNYQIVLRTSSSGASIVTATPYKAPYQELADGLNRLSDSIGNIAIREAFVRDCLIANGWRQATESEISLTVDAYARVGLNTEVEYFGKATGYLDGTGKINISSSENNQCVGTFSYNTTRTGGSGVVRCNDGDTAEIKFTSINNASGYGSGVSRLGKVCKTPGQTCLSAEGS
jgi:hypothetical protein